MKMISHCQPQYTFLFQNLLDSPRNAFIKIFMLRTGILAHCFSQPLHGVSILSDLQLETLAFNSDHNGSIIFRSGD